MIDLAPCKGCKERLTGERDKDCHTTCEKFQAVLRYIHEINRKAREEKIIASENMKTMLKENYEPRKRR